MFRIVKEMVQVISDQGRVVVMIGTSLSTKGGISSVVDVILRSTHISDGMIYISTHSDRGSWSKIQMTIIGLQRLLGLILCRKVRILHVHCASGWSFWRKLLFMTPAFFTRIPVILHWHGGGFVKFYDESYKPGKKLIAWVFRRCDRVIALSEEWKGILTGLFPAARVDIVSNPVDVPTTCACLGLDPPTVLFLGRISSAKGVNDLVQAWPLVLKSVPFAKLVLGGIGDIDENRDLAESLGIGHSIEMTGWVEGSRKRELLQKSWLFVLPSHAEALPMAVLEAMAWGLPVVATRVGGIPYAVRDGEDGLLVDVGDVEGLANALTEVLVRCERRVAMGASARRRVEESFSADVIVPRLKQVWRDVLAEHGDLGPV